MADVFAVVKGFDFIFDNVPGFRHRETSPDLRAALTSEWDFLSSVYEGCGLTSGSPFTSSWRINTILCSLQDLEVFVRT